MTDALPLSGRLAWWATAWLRGLVVTDLVLEAVTGDGRLHQSADGTPLVVLLGELRAGGATGCGLALPVPGDLLGVGGPRVLNDLALDHGEAMVCSGAAIALVPELAPEVVVWHRAPAAARQLPDVGDADRQLRAETIRAADALAALDVARWRPEAADLLLDAVTGQGGVPAGAPPGTPERCVLLAHRGRMALEVAALALDDDGGSTSASEASLRREALLPLAAAARRALVAACSAEVWPPP